ncbi:unnamed protein product [Urochloa humidicola]
MTSYSRLHREAAAARDWTGGLGTDALLAIFHWLDHIDVLPPTTCSPRGGAPPGRTSGGGLACVRGRSARRRTVRGLLLGVCRGRRIPLVPNRAGP